MSTRYEPHDWISGASALSADKLNNIEQGILKAVPVGSAIMYLGVDDPPEGFLFLDGATHLRADCQALWDFAVDNGRVGVFSTQFGVGDGSTTFTLPDWRTRFPMGAVTASNAGASGGSQTHTHTNPSTASAGAHTHTGPSHTHSITNSGTHTHTAGTYITGTETFKQVVQSGTGVTVADQNHQHAVTQTSGAGGNHNHGGSTGSAGTGATSSNGAHTHTQGNTGSSSNMPPWVEVNFIVAI